VADSTLQLLFTAETGDLDKASEKLVQLGSHMPTVGEAIEGLAKSFAGLPAPIALAAAAIAGFGVAAAEGASKAKEQIEALEKLSNQSGVSVEKLQEMQVAMAISGQSTDNLGQMFNKLNKAINEAQDPATKSAVAMQMLGVSAAELATGDSAEIMQHIAASLNQMAPGANKAALEMQIFGKSGAEADTILQSLTENGERAKQMLADHGAATADDIEAQKNLNASLEEAKLAFQGMGLAVLREVTPAIQTVVEWFDNTTKVSGPLVTTVKEVWEETKTLAVELWNVIQPFVELGEEIFKTSKGMADGAAQGSFFKELISELGQVFSFAVSLVRPFVVVLFDVYEILKTAGQGVVALANALEDVLEGKLKAAGQEFVKFGEQIRQNNADFLAFKQAQEDAADGLNEIAITAKKIKEPVDEVKNSVDSLAQKFKEMQEAKKVAEAMEKLSVEIEGQQRAADAAGQSLEAYRKEQNDAAIGAEALALHLKEGSKAFNDFVAAKQKLAAVKDTTKDEVAGLTSIAKLQEEINALTSHGTALEKAKAEIASSPGMKQAQQEELLAKAKELDADKQQLEVDKSVAAMKASVTRDIDSQKAALTLTANALKLYNQEAKLTAQAEKDAFNKTPEQVAKINAQLKQSKKDLEDNNTATQQWTQSISGFNAGATQAFGNFATDALNANKLGNQFVSQGLNGMTTALTEVGTKGSQAFKDLAASMLKMIEQAAAKILIVEAIATAVTAIWGTGAGDAVWNLAGGKPKGFANGGAFEGGVQAFADGGVVGGPTLFNMGLMGEAGPEAIMPLQRGADGKLGVTMNGGQGGGGGGGDVHHHNTFVINSNQPAVDVAKQTKKATTTAAKFTKSTMTQQKRPGGILSNQPHAFAR
jgi:lambda family phage tail tape measure protein